MYKSVCWLCMYIYIHIFIYICILYSSGLWETVFRSLYLYTQSERLTIKLTLRESFGRSKEGCFCFTLRMQMTFEDLPHAAAPFSPAPIGAPGWGCLLWASSQPGSPLHARRPPMCPGSSSSSAASLFRTQALFRTNWEESGISSSLFWFCLLTWAACVGHLTQAQLVDASDAVAVMNRGDSALFCCIYIYMCWH